MAIAIFAVLFSSFIACTPAPKKEIGLQLYSLRDTIKIDLKGTIEKVGKMGYTFVEAAGYADGKFYGMEPAEFKALIEANGMKLLGSHTGQNLPDSANWESTMQWWDQCIAAHKTAGILWIVQPWMGKEGYDTIPGLKKYCDYFNAVGEKCNAQGIRFGYHNHNKEFEELDGQIIYDFMLNNTDPAKVMFQIDLYWIMKGGKNSIDYFNKYPGRFEVWHVKDEAELGASGQMDFKSIFDNGQNSGKKYIVVEVERYNFDPVTSVQKSIDFLNKAEFVK